MSGMTDPESREYLKTLDSGIRRNDKIVGLLWFGKGITVPGWHDLELGYRLVL
jgi:hypothetical protein